MKTAVIENGQPLALSSDEQILFHQNLVSLLYYSGGSFPGNCENYFSKNGNIFLTNYRLVYSPETYTGVDAFL